MEWLSDLWVALTHLHTLPYTPQQIIMKGMCHFTFGFLVGSPVLPLWTTLAALGIVNPTAGHASLRDRFNALIAFPLRVMVASAIANVFVDVDHLSLLFGPRDDYGRMLHGEFFWIGATVALYALIRFLLLLRKPNGILEASLQHYIFCGFIGSSWVMHVLEDSTSSWWF